MDDNELSVPAGVPTELSLPTLVAQATHDGPIWSHTSEQLNLNLLRFKRGDGIPPHRNTDLDVVIVGVVGVGIVTLDETRQRIAPGSMVVIPRGAERAITAESDDFAYLSCHQRRAALQPVLPAQPGDGRA